MVNQTGWMTSYTVQVAKTHLSRILHDVEAGEEVVIIRGNRAVARLVPIATPQPRTFGTMSFRVPDDFDAPLPDEEFQVWE